MTETTYTLRGIQAMLGISRGVLTGLISAGFVTPQRGKRNEYRFSFQDVVLLRTAVGLQAANIPPRKILRSLKRLKATLPSELPLSGLRITAVGSEVAVKDGHTHWGADSGQLLMDFEIRPAAQGSVRFLAGKTPLTAEPTLDPTELFNRGVELEGKDKASAEAAYRQAIGAAPDYVDPYLNLGVMLCDAGRCDEAVALYAQALKHQPDEALLVFNLAIALEDMKREKEALAAYERCLQIDPKFADAHFNVARLHDEMGHANRAIRHYSEYRRLQGR